MGQPNRNLTLGLVLGPKPNFFGLSLFIRLHFLGINPNIWVCVLPLELSKVKGEKSQLMILKNALVEYSCQVINEEDTR